MREGLTHFSPPAAGDWPVAKPGSRVLAVRGGALGDFLLTLPAVQSIRMAGFEVEWLTRPTYGRLMVATGHAAGWRDLESADAATFTTGCSDPGRTAWSDWIRTFAAVVSWVPDPDRRMAQTLSQNGAIPFWQGNWKCAATGPASLQLAENLPGSAESVLQPFRFFPSPADLKQPPRSWAAWHPGSGSRTKNWPLQKWIPLLQQVQATYPDLRWKVITGEAEEADREMVYRALGQAGIPFETAHGLPLTELTARLRECSVLFGHDTGISHLAAACGVACRLVFGPTNPAVWAPLGEDVRVACAPGKDLPLLSPAAALDQWTAGGTLPLLSSGDR